MLICWDLAFPEAFRELVAKGVEVVIVPTFCELPLSLSLFLSPRSFLIGEPLSIRYILTLEKGTRRDASPTALSLNPNSEALFLESTITSRCFENTCAIIFANVSGPQQDRYLGMSRVCLPHVGPVGGKTMGAAEEGPLVVEMDLGVLEVAEENYRVREDIGREGWHYVYRHMNMNGK